MTQPDWIKQLLAPSKQCVHIASLSPSVLEAMKKALTKKGFKIAELNGATMAGDAALFTALGQAFHFPDYFGKNWDALDELLRDMEWLPASGYVIIVAHADTLWKKAPGVLTRLVESVAFVSEEWAKDAIPFHLILTGKGGLAPKDFGAAAAPVVTH